MASATLRLRFRCNILDPALITDAWKYDDLRRY
jgi:hypothetical protein